MAENESLDLGNRSNRRWRELLNVGLLGDAETNDYPLLATARNPVGNGLNGCLAHALSHDSKGK